ncbi:T9SS type A sorting domain-containing protein [Maribellus mangrovi]|uniref:T9SS type A sorting domain-containing protein n=1 Tax=Maribellus mangrovi TaxID=3133146 RepID=UPI0030ECAD4F
MKNLFKNTRLILTTIIVINSSISRAQFEEIPFNITGTYFSDVHWADCDNDGDLDVCIAGYSDTGAVSFVYNNINGNSFDLVLDNPILGAFSGDFVPGDYDNDGYIDMLLTGKVPGSDPTTKVYRNLGNNIFSEQTGIEVLGMGHSTAAWGDCNNDGYLDILLSGVSLEPFGFFTKIYLNNHNNTFSELNSIDLIGTYEGSVTWGDYDNDGNLDILLTGHSDSGIVSKIYRNNGDSTFTEQTDILLTGIQQGTAIWGDYDKDGDLDILLTGEGVSKIYQNNGDNSFIEQTGINLQKLSLASADWGDYDNDGFLDIIMAGRTENLELLTIIYHNNGDNTFTKYTDIIIGIHSGTVKWGDYNTDGKLDFIISGRFQDGAEITKVYKNIINTESNSMVQSVSQVETTNNVPPNMVTSTSSEVSENTVFLKWLPTTDDHTPSKSLSYNVRVGTSPGSNDIVSSCSDTSGYFRLAQMGNAQLDTFFILKELAIGTYYWSVQAIDNSFKGGAFSQEDSFTIEAVSVVVSSYDSEVAVFPNPTNGYIQITGMENSYGLNYRILNLTGQIVQQGSVNAGNIQMQVNPGLYILNLTQDNNVIHCLKIIVK